MSVVDKLCPPLSSSSLLYVHGMMIFTWAHHTATLPPVTWAYVMKMLPNLYHGTLHVYCVGHTLTIIHVVWEYNYTYKTAIPTECLKTY